MAFAAGDILTAAELGGLKDAWTSYTPAWTSGGTQPVLNNGTLTGKYRQVGKTIEAKIHLAAGNTTTFGTGQYFLSLPVAALEASQIGTVLLVDSGTANKAAICFVVTGALSTIAMVANTSDVAATVPHTMANGDQIHVHIQYEVA